MIESACKIIGSVCDKAVSFAGAYPLLGWIIAFGILLLFVFSSVADLIPKLGVIKADLLLPIAKRFRFHKLVKAATKADIQNNVNAVVRRLSHELPKDWIRDMAIKWVELEGKDDLFNDDEAVIRMRPLENQDLNFLTATYYFFKKSFFPKTRDVIPQTYRDASVLFTTRRVVDEQKDKLKTLYEDKLLEPAIEKDKKIITVLEKYGEIDDHGFFTGTFLREIHAVASEARFNKLRFQMSKETHDILAHIEEFMGHYKSKLADKNFEMPDKLWSRIGPVTHYGFLLVAHPIKAAFGADAYINRVKEKLVEGVDRLYVFGTAQEREFAIMVINSICGQVPKYKLVERFLPSKDYRGEIGGVGALFIKRDNSSNLA